MAVLYGSSPVTSSMTQMNLNRPINIAVVGDVHDLWDSVDQMALQHLGVDLVLLVGDFGNESIETVREIASLDLPKAAILGNHDAWYSATDWGLKKCPYDRTQEDWVQAQMDLLTEANVGYGKRDFPELDLSVVGSRPFSWGGPVWKNAEFYRQRFGVTTFEASTARIVSTAKDAASQRVIFLGHNGPTGLGDAPEDPCGKDWQPIGGDHGDPDLQAAIAQTKAAGKQVPLVVFGHMHHHLLHTKARLRTPVYKGSDGTVYFNGARVPRILKTDAEVLHNFSLVSLTAQGVIEIALIWIDQDLHIREQEVLYSLS